MLATTKPGPPQANATSQDSVPGLSDMPAPDGLCPDERPRKPVSRASTNSISTFGGRGSSVRAVHRRGDGLLIGHTVGLAGRPGTFSDPAPDSSGTQGGACVARAKQFHLYRDGVRRLGCVLQRRSTPQPVLGSPGRNTQERANNRWRPDIRRLGAWSERRIRRRRQRRYLWAERHREDCRLFQRTGMRVRRIEASFAVRRWFRRLKEREVLRLRSEQRQFLLSSEARRSRQ